MYLALMVKDYEDAPQWWKNFCDVVHCNKELPDTDNNSYLVNWFNYANLVLYPAKGRMILGDKYPNPEAIIPICVESYWKMYFDTAEDFLIFKLTYS